MPISGKSEIRWPIILRGRLRRHLRMTECTNPMGCFVYMLRCADNSYYVGNAAGDDISKRIVEHQTGAYPGYTYSRRPVQLVWSDYFDRITDAIAAERQIKGWSRAKKEALIRGEWDLLKRLAKRRAGRPSLS